APVDIPLHRERSSTPADPFPDQTDSILACEEKTSPYNVSSAHHRGEAPYVPRRFRNTRNKWHPASLQPPHLDSSGSATDYVLGSPPALPLRPLLRRSVHNRYFESIPRNVCLPQPHPASGLETASAAILRTSSV